MHGPDWTWPPPPSIPARPENLLLQNTGNPVLDNPRNPGWPSQAYHRRQNRRQEKHYCKVVKNPDLFIGEHVNGITTDRFPWEIHSLQFFKDEVELNVIEAITIPDWAYKYNQLSHHPTPEISGWLFELYFCTEWAINHLLFPPDLCNDEKSGHLVPQPSEVDAIVCHITVLGQWGCTERRSPLQVIIPGTQCSCWVYHGLGESGPGRWVLG